MLSSLSGALILLPTLAFAETYVYGLTTGTAPSEGYDTFVAANEHPNASHSVSFKHDRGIPTSNSTLNQDWTWTVKVSDVAVANDTAFPNAHVAFTTYEFTWPELGTLDDALSAEYNASTARASLESCAIIFDTIFPPNVTSKYNSSSSDCTSALGADCVAALTSLMSSVGENCTRLSESLSSLRKPCSTSLGATLGSGYAVSRADFGTYASNPNTTRNLNKSQTYAYGVSNDYAGGNETAYDLYAQNLHILGLVGDSTTLLCNAAAPGPRTGAAPRALGVSSISMALVTFAIALSGFV